VTTPPQQQALPWSLPQTSPRDWVRRQPWSKTTPSALVAEPAQMDSAARELRSTFAELNLPFVEAELDGRLQRRQDALSARRPVTVVVASRSEDPALWRQIDLHLSRLEDGSATLFLLSPKAARSMTRNAPHLASRRRPMSAYQGSLEPLIHDAAGARYPELYEAVDDRPARDIEPVVDEILTVFGDPRVDDEAWRRFGYVGRALLLEVLPTISGHRPAAVASAQAVLTALDRWLSSSSAPGPALLDVQIDGPRAPQAIAEAIDVVCNAARLADRSCARGAVAEMVDDCLQGYAVFPGSAGRRSLFDWWLHDVVPAAWSLQRPVRFHDAAAQA
jgi:hypothetical protein